jgi:hypothetical protein
MRVKLYFIFLYLGIACMLIACYSWTIITPTVIANLSPSPTQTSTIQPTGTIMPKAIATLTLTPSCYVKTNIPDGHLNMRSHPSEISTIVTVLNEGQMLYPIGPVRDGWVAVATITGEQVGYVKASYTTCQEEK